MSWDEVARPCGAATTPESVSVRAVPGNGVVTTGFHARASLSIVRSVEQEVPLVRTINNTSNTTGRTNKAARCVKFALGCQHSSGLAASRDAKAMFGAKDRDKLKRCAAACDSDARCGCAEGGRQRRTGHSWSSGRRRRRCGG